MTTVKITVKTPQVLILPMTPNFLRTADKDLPIDVADLTEEQLREIGAMWTKALIKKAVDRRLASAVQKAAE